MRLKAMLFAVWASVLCGVTILAQDLPSGLEAVPDGVTIEAFGGGGFRVVSVASAPCRGAVPGAVMSARTVALAKAKAAMARFLDETVSVEEFVERESVRVRTGDGTDSAVARADVRRTLVRIKTESSALLRGVRVLGTQFVPAPGGGGTLRLAAAVDSAGLADAEAAEGVLAAPETGGTFGN